MAAKADQQGEPPKRSWLPWKRGGPTSAGESTGQANGLPNGQEKDTGALPSGRGSVKDLKEGSSDGGAPPSPDSALKA